MKRLLRPFALMIVVALSALPLTARAELHIDITRGKIEPLPIAIPAFAGGASAANDITQVVSADLERSGLFKPIDPQAFVDKDPASHVPPNYGDWRVINAQALLTGSATQMPDGRLQVEFRLWDVFAQQQLTGLRYTTTASNWRRIAHIIADAVYKRITGEDGYFDTRIVYIAESGPLDHRVKRLAIMDQDGANNRYLTDGKALVLTPRFSPSTQEITYLSYARGTPRVYLFNIDTGQQEVLGDFPGMTFAPRFSPDGNRVIMSLSVHGASQIYTLDLRTRRAVQLTNTEAIDTSPCFSPDGQHIVFNSDRGGSQQLYVMNADGGNVHRISFGSGRYGTPVWSPRGDLIAFTKIDNGQFYIGVMHPDGSGERLLTSGFLVEGPSWAPNGRVLIYFRQTAADARGRGSSSRLYTIDLTGYNEREVVTPTDASDPAWSPLLP
ncbi:MAG: Tol-Pal system protein TolB [Alphaproteobacteria bacterium]|nr:Tol-Pal system protein TolB [Alphaproteobacteria bacterium]MDE1967637.1 Tol-Pal system protein TolB [Alphaproteobacteria bacterium]MDE2512834.1 Tol-Pal system protein TolB [Alphaproteobacteria bacterium]